MFRNIWGPLSDHSVRIYPEAPSGLTGKGQSVVYGSVKYQQVCGVKGKIRMWRLMKFRRWHRV